MAGVFLCAPRNWPNQLSFALKIPIGLTFTAGTRHTRWTLAPSPRAREGTTMLLARLLSRALGEGRLTIIDASGRAHRMAGPRPGPAVTVRIHDRPTQLRLFLRPRLAFGEAYMDGKLTVEQGDIYDALDLLGRNMPALEATWPVRLSYAWQRLVRVFEQHNPIGIAQRNVAH